MSASFGSDNHSGAHPKIFEALARANVGHAPSYGGDPWSERAESLFRREFGPEAQIFFVFNGTGANVLALSALVEPHHAILCARDAHVWNDECGAPERWTGAKLMPLPAVDGKLLPETVEEALIRGGDQHWSQPRALTLTQTTELGTVYRPEELRAFGELARRRGLRLHVDGARLVNAAAFLGVSLAEAAGPADVISFGGTKNGLLYGEAVVFRTAELAREFKFRRKQGMQLPSKTRFVAAQFEALLGADPATGRELWREIAGHGLAMAARLEAALRRAGVTPTRPRQGNAVFARLPKAWIGPLRERSFFYVWDEKTFECRLMTSFDTTEADVDAFAAHAAELAKAPAKA